MRRRNSPEVPWPRAQYPAHPHRWAHSAHQMSILTAVAHTGSQPSERCDQPQLTPSLPVKERDALPPNTAPRPGRPPPRRPLTSAAHSMRLSPLSRGWKRPSSSRWRFSCRNSRSASLPISGPAGRRRRPPAARTKGTGRPPLAGGRSRSAGDANRGPRGLLGGREREPGSRHRTDAGGLPRGHRIQAGRPAPPPAAGPARRPAASHGAARGTVTIPGPAELPLPLPPPPPRPRIKMEAARPRPRVFVLPARRWPRAERSRRGPAGEAPRGGKIVRGQPRTLAEPRKAPETGIRRDHPAAPPVTGAWTEQRFFGRSDGS